MQLVQLQGAAGSSEAGGAVAGGVGGAVAGGGGGGVAIFIERARLSRRRSARLAHGRLFCSLFLRTVYSSFLLPWIRPHHFSRLPRPPRPRPRPPPLVIFLVPIPHSRPPRVSSSSSPFLLLPPSSSSLLVSHPPHCFIFTLVFVLALVFILFSQLAASQPPITCVANSDSRARGLPRGSPRILLHAGHCPLQLATACSPFQRSMEPTASSQQRAASIQQPAASSQQPEARIHSRCIVHCCLVV